jgi:hypothetical protein
MSQLTLRLIKEHFAIHSFSENAIIPSEVYSARIFFLAKTYDEISIVLPQNIDIDSDEVELNWQALEVVGPLAFTMTGILSNISTVLANEKISIFAISTFDTDYILVKEERIEAAIQALRANQYIII